MKYLIVLLSLLLSSCMTVKRIEKHCLEFAKICEVPIKKEDTIIRYVQIETVYRDTTIYVEVPGETIIKKVPVYINKGISNSDLSVINVPFARGMAQVINSKLIHELTQTDTILRVKLENALKAVKTIEKENKVLKDKVVVTVKENSKFAGFTIKVFWGVMIVVILGIGYLILKYKSKLLSWLPLRLIKKV